MNNLPLAPQKFDSAVAEQEIKAVLDQMFPPKSEEPQTDFDFQLYLNVLKKRKWLIIAPLLIVLPLVSLWLLSQKLMYEATVTLLIEPVSPRILDIQEVLGVDPYREYYETQYSLIKSRAIVEKVIDTLRSQKKTSIPQGESGVSKLIDTIVQFPRTLLRTIKEKMRGKENTGSLDVVEVRQRERLMQIKQLQDSIGVRPLRGTRLVNITISGFDPEEITTQVNTLAEIYVAQNLETKIGTSREASMWLAKEVTALKEELHNAELALQEFMKSRGFIPAALDEGQTFLREGERFSDIKTLHDATKTQRINLETQIHALEQVLGQPTEKLPSLAIPPTNNPSIGALQQRYADLKGQLASLSRSFKEKHPKILLLHTEMEQVKQRIKEELQKAIDGIKSEYNIVLNKEKALEAAMNKQKADAFRLNK